MDLPLSADNDDSSRNVTEADSPADGFTSQGSLGNFSVHPMFWRESS